MGKSSPNGPANGQRKRPSFLKALFLTATFPNLNLISRFLLLQFTELHTHSIVNLQNYFLPGNLESEIAGFAAAILLRILGVTQEMVMFDYLLSNQYYFKPLRRNLIMIALAKGRKTARWLQVFWKGKLPI